MKWNLIIPGSVPTEGRACPRVVTGDVPESSDDAVVLVVDDAGSPALDAAAVPHLALPGPHALGGVNLGKAETEHPKSPQPSSQTQHTARSELHHRHCGSATRTGEMFIILQSQNTELLGTPTLITAQLNHYCSALQITPAQLTFLMSFQALSFFRRRTASLVFL